jgi:PPM family protein phosphatase
VQATFGAHSRCGRLHATNTDHYVIIRLGRQQTTLLTSLPDDLISDRFDEYGYAMVVADGLGESSAGERASRLAIATLMHLVLHFGKWNLRIDNKIAQEIMDRAGRFYRHVDSAVVHEGMKDRGPRPETTLTAVFGAGRDLFFAHVGHSRAYLFRDLRLMRLTRDHTVAERQSWNVPVAPLVDVNVSAKDLKHILTETIGMAGSVGPTIDLERFQLIDGDRVLVCTNGVTDPIDESRIGEVLALGKSPDEQSRMLVELATAAGGDDDATALVAHYSVPATS